MLFHGLFVAAICLPFLSCELNDRIIDRTDWGKINFSDYHMCNNVWNKGTITDYSQLVYITRKSNFPVGWEYSWPSVEGEDTVRTYPAIHYGWNLWDGTATATTLPAAVGDINGFTATLDLEATVDPGTKYNLSFDIWITEHNYVTNPAVDNITREIMIWIDCSDNAAFSSLTVVNIDGDDYYFDIVPDWPTDDYIRDYIVFLRKDRPGPGSHSKTYNIKAFLDYLSAQGPDYLTDTEYVAFFSLGNEIWHGSGDMRISNYEVSVW